MVNFLALLGWSPGDDRELLSKAELIESFTLEGISGGNAVFNTEKLDWMNGQYIGRMTAAELASAVRPLLASAGLEAQPVVSRSAGFRAAARAAAPPGQAAHRLRGSGGAAAERSGGVRAGGREAPVSAGAGAITSRRWPGRSARSSPLQKHRWKQRCER